MPDPTTYNRRNVTFALHLNFTSVLLCDYRLLRAVIAVRNFARNFLGHSPVNYIFNNLGNTNCYFKIVHSKCFLHFERLFSAI